MSCGSSPNANPAIEHWEKTPIARTTASVFRNDVGLALKIEWFCADYRRRFCRVGGNYDQCHEDQRVGHFV